MELNGNLITQIVKNMKNIVLFILLLTAIKINATDITITWDIPKDSKIAGYYLELQSESGLGLSQDIGLCKRYTIQNLIEGRKYWFYITPYDSTKNKGEQSNIIVYMPKQNVVNNYLPKPHIRIEKE